MVSAPLDAPSNAPTAQDAPAATDAPNGPDVDTRLLAADVGSVFTRVYVVEEVEGERRLVAVGQAPTVADTGQPAVAAALDQALARAIEHAGQREATAERSRLLMTSLSAVPHIALVVPRQDDARALVAALESLPVRVLDPIVREDAAGAPEALLGQVEAQAPDAVIVSGGTRAADLDLAQGAVEAIARGFGPRAPLIVLAGSEAFVSAAAPLLDGLRSVNAAGDPARIGSALREAAVGVAAQRLDAPGWHAVAAGWAVPLTSSLDGVCAATELVAERYDVDALTLDLGAGHAMAVAVTNTTGQRRLAAVARDDLGLRLGRLRLLREAGAAQINRWLPADLDELALLNDARRGALLPAGLPESVDELLLDHAYAREALRLVILELARTLNPSSNAPSEPLPPIDLLIGSGGVLAAAPRLMQAALILLDAAQPQALTQLALDRAAALPLLGQIGRSEGADSLGAAFERDALLNLGLCIAPIGSGREGETAIKVEVAYTSRSPITVEVPFGAIEVVPLPIGERAALELWPAKEFDIGLGRGNAAKPGSEVEGGAVGIIVDARGRPLTVPETAEKRQAKLLQWLQGTGAYPQLSFVQVPATNGKSGS